jgi:predicted heme/steroid binding protein
MSDRSSQSPLLALLANVLVAFAVLALSPRAASGTEEYAACTARPCAHCHESPSGGGALTPRGSAFAQAVAAGEAPPGAATTLRRYGRAAVLYAHIVTAFLWFGTILYVHLILKPAYASRGLPRDELRLGWAGIAGIAVTGTILTLLRIDSWHTLLHTRFGVLLCVKMALFLVMAATAALVTFVIGPRLGRQRARGPHPGRGDFTPEDLALFDGREGRQALVALGGRVYDLSGSPLWAGGSHVRRHGAGNDLTAAIGQAPHGAEKLAAFPQVGTLVASTESAGAGRPPHERGFFFMAYLNLGIVAAVLLVITLWRM